MTELTNQACGLSLQSVLPRITKKKKKKKSGEEKRNWRERWRKRLLFEVITSDEMLKGPCERFWFYGLICPVLPRHISAGHGEE